MPWRSALPIDRSVVRKLTPKQRTDLVRLAALVSRKAGYCDEVIHILNLMGFNNVPIFRSEEEVEKYEDLGGE
jgi:hypothetical protein